MSAKKPVNLPSKEEIDAFLAKVKDLMRKAPPDVKAYFQEIHVAALALSFIIDYELALIPFCVEDGEAGKKTLWGVFKAPGATSLTKDERAKLEQAFEQDNLDDHESLLTLDLLPISLGLCEDPIDAINQAELMLNMGDEEVQ